jgi:hypothetical protein
MNRTTWYESKIHARRVKRGNKILSGYTHVMPFILEQARAGKDLAVIIKALKSRFGMEMDFMTIRDLLAAVGEPMGKIKAERAAQRKAAKEAMVPYEDGEYVVRPKFKKSTVYQHWTLESQYHEFRLEEAQR